MKSTEISYKFTLLLQNIQNAPIIENSYFILGAGKFGQIALDYVLKQPGLPYILIIDRNIDIKLEGFQNASSLMNIYDTLSTELKRRFFIQKEIDVVAEILQHGFPEFLIPAVPIHAVAYIIKSLIVYYQPDIHFQSTIPIDQWDRIIQSIPNEVLLSQDRTNGVILLSWAKFDEICSPNCPAPIDFCPYHKRVKSQTITDLCKKMILHGVHSYIIESHQVKAGLGMIHGNELKNTLLSYLKKLKNDMENAQTHLATIATTCNCHGVINAFMCSRL